MRRRLLLLMAAGFLATLAGCGKDVVEGSVPVTSTDAFKKLKGNTPRPPIVPQR